jgi:hypothetical protein
MKSLAQSTYDLEAALGRPPQLPFQFGATPPIAAVETIGGGISWCHQGKVYISNRYLKRDRDMCWFEMRLTNNLGLHYSSTTHSFDNIFEASNIVDKLYCM